MTRKTEHIGISEIEIAGDDVVVPFQVGPLDVRGRAVQLGTSLNSILSRHDYPEPVAVLLGEMIVLTALLGTSLKFDGNFIVQTQSDGPVSLGVVDFSTPGSVRAYARYDEERIGQLVRDGKAITSELLGNGALAMTIDQGDNMQRYQGIVELDGHTLEDAAHQYFRQSEQIPTRVRLAVAQSITPAKDGAGSVTVWRAGGAITQFLPEAPERMHQPDFPGGDVPEGQDELETFEDDAWAEASSLMDTIGDDELTDPQISAERLLFRLFNEHGVRVFDGIEIIDQCSCTREKVVALVRTFDDEEGKSKEDVTTVCEFCSTTYHIKAEELD